MCRVDCHCVHGAGGGEGASKTAPLEKARFIRDLKEICLKYKHAHSLKCSPFKNAVLFRFLKI